MGWWIFGCVVVAIVIGMLALDWITAGRGGSPSQRTARQVTRGGEKVNWGMVQQELRQAGHRKGHQSS